MSAFEPEAWSQVEARAEDERAGVALRALQQQHEQERAQVSFPIARSKPFVPSQMIQLFSVIIKRNISVNDIATFQMLRYCLILSVCDQVSIG